jgi:hypothetical protein
VAHPEGASGSGGVSVVLRDGTGNVSGV